MFIVTAARAIAISTLATSFLVAAETSRLPASQPSGLFETSSGLSGNQFTASPAAYRAEFSARAVSFEKDGGQLRMEFVNARPREIMPSASGRELTYRDAWPGIDVAYSGYRRSLKSEFRVSPGADPSLIRIRYDGGGRPRLLPDGSLLVSGATGGRAVELVDSAPVTYQVREGATGTRIAIPSSYRVESDGTVTFAVGPYDKSRTLVIDPAIYYSTFFGGSNQTSVTAVALDAWGNAIVTGWTTSTDLACSGARRVNAGSVDAFVAKISMNGNQVAWCTYLGGSGDDRAFGVAVDASNNVYVTGWTYSTNFPTVSPIQAKLAGGRDAFITKLNPSGTAILYSTYLGGSDYDQGNAIAVDTAGNIYVAGDTLSATFPIRNSYQATNNGQQDAFLVKLNAAGSAIQYSTFLGGNGAEHAAGIALDASGNLYVTGSTYSANFPVASATQPRIGGGQDAFVAELNATGGLVFSTYIGGSGGTVGLGEGGNAVAVDFSGNVYVAGSTSSIDFPTTASAFQKTAAGGHEDHGFVWKINAAKNTVLYSTYLGGTNLDMINGLAVDPAGNAYLVGSTSSADFPGLRGFQGTNQGLTDGFLTKLNASGSALIFSSYLGGTHSDTANAVAIDSRQNIVVAGIAGSQDFPLLNAAMPYNYGLQSGFVTRVVNGWYPIAFAGGGWFFDFGHNGGSDGVSSTLTYIQFGQSGDVPIVGDWANNGHIRMGVFRNGLWILDTNGNGQIDAGDRQFMFGQAGDIPVVGDWDGTGKVKAGIYRGGTFALDLSGHLSGVATGKSDLVFPYGMAGDIPVVGDWGSTSVTKIGVFRRGTWFLDSNNSHSYDTSDATFAYGMNGDVPIVGDWDGSGSPSIGIVRGGQWFLNIEGTRSYTPRVDLQFAYGNSLFTFLTGY